MFINKRNFAFRIFHLFINNILVFFILQCESIVENIKQKLEANWFDLKGEICPVCYDEVSEDKHRLQCCGHAYCTECFLHLLQNVEVIPLKCEVEVTVYANIYLFNFYITACNIILC